MSDGIRAGIVGGGFIAGVHAHAVRAAGGTVQRVAGSTPGRAEQAAARLRAAHAAGSFEELVAANDVDVVHVCTPNALHTAMSEAVLDAGKAVVCEKPLATSPEDAARLVGLALASGQVAAVPFVYRYYPTVREARSRIAAGTAGPLWLLHGSYLQDWLSHQDEANWRMDPAQGGAARVFGDIGVHWCDLMEFTTGHRITRLTARMASAFEDVDRPDRQDTDDGTIVMFETDHGAAGSVVVSQVSPGRKNRLWFSFDGPRASYSFDQELPELLWVGSRDQTVLVARGGDTESSEAGRFSRLPAGHPQGYQDCFNAFVREVYAAVREPDAAGYPTFEDGHRAALLTAAVVDSARQQDWVDVPRERVGAHQ